VSVNTQWHFAGNSCLSVCLPAYQTHITSPACMSSQCDVDVISHNKQTNTVGFSVQKLRIFIE